MTWVGEAKAVLKDTFADASEWWVTVGSHDGRAYVRWDLDVMEGEPEWNFDHLAAISERLGTKRIWFTTDDSRGMGSEWTGPYGSIEFTIWVEQEVGQ